MRQSEIKSGVGSVFCYERFVVDYQLGFCRGHLGVWTITCLISRWPNSPQVCIVLIVLRLFILMQARKKCLQFGLLLFSSVIFVALGLTMEVKLKMLPACCYFCLGCVSFSYWSLNCLCHRHDKTHATRWRRPRLLWTKLDSCPSTLGNRRFVLNNK